MVRIPIRRLIVVVICLGILATACGINPISPVLSAEKRTELKSLQENRDVIPCDIRELTFVNDRIYDNKFFDVSLTVDYTAPDGSRRQVKGFYYQNNLWRIRFRPDMPGTWKFDYEMSDKNGSVLKGAGGFDCESSETERLIRQDPDNLYRWIFSGGKPYFPIGIQDCIYTRNGQPQDVYIDGEGRTDNSSTRVSRVEYFQIFHKAGFNLYRWSHNNCSYNLFDDLDHYRLPEVLATDGLLQRLRKNGFRIMFGFFGSYDDFQVNDVELVEKQQRFISYCIARWGVYVDFWELLNESNAPDNWTNMMADYVFNTDPDHKPISTSWEKPKLPGIDIISPHWYESESEFNSDLRVKQQAIKWKRNGKPVIVGEQGNTGMNWDPHSGLRMRIRTWTALFEEISFIFWNTSWSKAGMYQGNYTPGATANIYLGPEERSYIRVLKDFSSQLDSGMQMTPVVVSSPNRVRAYGLLSESVAAVYLHHFRNHENSVNDIKITVDLPGGPESNTELTGEWIEPATGNVIGRISIDPGRQVLVVPAFTIDLALLVTSGDNSSDQE